MKLRTPTMKGSCLCASVAFEITAPTKSFQYCFCSRCRKRSGSAHGANLFVPVEQFRWLQGQDKTALYKLPEAKRFTACFCTTCGSPLPWQVPGGNNMVVPAGVLDDQLDSEPQQSIFWGSRATWYISPCKLPSYDELPPRK